MKIFVVIPNWNGAEMLRECIESLKAQTLKHQIVVADNASSDNSVDLLKKHFSSVVILENNTNLGFAGGVNTGIRYALDHGATAIALFNNDAVADKNWLKELHNTLTIDNDTGIVTCKLLRQDKKHIDSTGDFYSVWGIPFPRGRNEADSGQFDSDIDVFGASGGASIYSTEMLKDIGIFDQKYFAYYEDVDLSFRARLAGWNVKYEPKAIAYHEVGGTSSKMGDFTRYHSIKNFLILYTKCMPAKLYFKYLPFFLYQFIRTTARSLVDRKPHVWLRAVGSFLAYLPAILKERRSIMKNRKITNSQLQEVLYTGRAPKIPEFIPKP